MPPARSNKPVDTDQLPLEFNMEELEKVLHKFKRHKAPGPDKVPMELYKLLPHKNKEQLLQQLNIWWLTETLPEEL
eukprot:5154575-Prorocentrum_lima.AAC.1